MEIKNWRKEVVDKTINQCKEKGVKLPYSKFCKWLIDLERVGHRFDSYLKAKCYKIYRRLRDDYDCFVVVHGKEGTGKSTLAIHMAATISPTFTHENICFTFKDVVRLIKKAEAGDVILIDEGAMNLYSREAVSKVNKQLTKLFMVMRQKNLCVIICIPNFHLLDTYVRDHRTDLLIGVKSRGNYTAYTERAIKRISKFGRKLKNVFGVRCKTGTFWYGHFLKDFPKNLDYDAYRKRKQDHMQDFIKEMEEPVVLTDNYVEAKRIDELLNFSRTHTVRKIKKGDIDGKKIGGKWYVTREDYKRLKGGLEL